MGRKSSPHTNTCICRKPHTHAHRRTPSPAAWWSTNRLCCQLLAFHQTKGWFLSHTQSFNFASRPLTDPSDYSSESRYGNQGLRTDYVLPSHTDTHTLFATLQFNLSASPFVLFVWNILLIQQAEKGNRGPPHAVGDSRWTPGSGHPFSGAPHIS